MKMNVCYNLVVWVFKELYHKFISYFLSSVVLYVIDLDFVVRSALDQDVATQRRLVIV